MSVSKMGCRPAAHFRQESAPVVEFAAAALARLELPAVAAAWARALPRQEAKSELVACSRPDLRKNLRYPLSASRFPRPKSDACSDLQNISSVSAPYIEQLFEPPYQFSIFDSAFPAAACPCARSVTRQ
jgi:hypothetical protein